MNRIFIAILLLFVIASAKKVQAQTWQTIDDFHTTLAFTYHPAIDEGNFEPIRKRSAELYDRAVAVQTAPLPACVKNEEEAKKLVNDLVEKTKKVDELVKENKSNEDIRKSFEEVHSLFHRIEGMCEK